MFNLHPRVRLQHPAAHGLDPLALALDRRQVLETVVGDEYDVLDAYATDALVFCEHLMVDQRGVAHRRKQMGREVDARLDGLRQQSAYPLELQVETALTTTMPASSGSLRRR